MFWRTIIWIKRWYQTQKKVSKIQKSVKYTIMWQKLMTKQSTTTWLTNLLHKSLPKKNGAFGDLWALPHPLWFIPWSFLSSCKKNSILMWVLHINNKKWMGRGGITSRTASLPEECTFQVCLSLLREQGI